MRSDKAGRHHMWTNEELGYLLTMAGKIPAQQICEDLGVTRSQLNHQRWLLNSQGANITLRCFVSKLEMCPACGHMRATVTVKGICKPCRMAYRIAQVRAKTLEAIQMLPENERSSYEHTEAHLGSSAYPAPVSKVNFKDDAYHIEKAQEEFDIAMEQWEIQNLKREMKAAYRRYERIVKRLR